LICNRKEFLFGWKALEQTATEWLSFLAEIYP